MVIVMAYKDNRNWAIYNDLGLEFLDSWDKELKKMNQGKRGRPFLHYGVSSSTLSMLRVRSFPGS